MGRDVVILGVSMTRIGKFMEKSFKSLATEAVDGVVRDAGLSKNQIQAAYVGNVQAGAISNQLVIKGQVWLRAAGIGDIPIVNTNNVCATGGTVINLAWQDVSSGNHDCVLAMGVEKMHSDDRQECFRWMNSAKDMDEQHERQGEVKHGDAIGHFASLALEYMKVFGLTKEQLGKVCEKNHFNASLNPYAQYRKVFTVDEILDSPIIVEPIHRSMCATIADGAAATILCSAEFARRYTSDPVFIAASILQTAAVEADEDGPSLQERSACQAYERAGLGPADVDVWEIGNPTSFNEIMSYEQLGICKKGEAPSLIEGNETALTGKMPVNPAGGHEGRGHPAAATGVAQITELVWQLRGDSGERQITERPKVCFAQIYGGDLGPEPAACATTIIKR
ncbi:MAG: thiolase family protein [Deltaproteobacteria bacterium]|nr:thiolase family protein [Deltaproteobacteria bacterium]